MLPLPTSDRIEEKAVSYCEMGKSQDEGDVHMVSGNQSHKPSQLSAECPDSHSHPGPLLYHFDQIYTNNELT